MDAGWIMDATPQSTSHRHRRREATHAALQDAAVELLSRRDFRSVSVEEICGAAAVSRATFFRHMGKKRGVADIIFQPLAEKADLALRQPGDAAEAIRTATDEVVSEWLTRGVLLRSVASELFAGCTTFSQSSNPIASLATSLSEALERGQRRDEFEQSVEPDLVARLILSIWITAPAKLSSERGDRLREIVSGLVEVTLRGMRKPLPTTDICPEYKAASA